MAAAQHPLFARLYARCISPSLRRIGADSLRRRALDGLAGTVIDVGAGDGANFAFYPDAVEHVVAVEPEPYLRARAAEAAAAYPVVDVVDGTAEQLPVPDAGADAVVFTLVLCTVTDPGQALAEARRVLRPGGELRVLEHVMAHEPGPLRSVQRALDATFWPLLAGGCHCARDTVGAVERAGFAFESLDRFTFPAGSRGLESSVVLGRAR